VIEVREEQFSKALPPILVTLLGIMKVTKSWQYISDYGSSSDIFYQ